MRRIVLITVVAALLGLLAGCSDNKRAPTPSDAIRGSGVLTTVHHSLPPFDELVLSAVGDVSITFGSPQSVEVTVDDNIMPHLVLNHSGTWLDIGIDQDINAVDYDLTVDVVMTDVESLTLAGIGNIVGQNQLQAESVALTLAGIGNIVMDTECNLLNTLLAGTGNLELSGSTAKHTTVLAGSGTVAAFELSADTSLVTIAGEGNIEVTTIDRLGVLITGTGNVSYRGNPSITCSITGTGQVIDAN